MPWDDILESFLSLRNSNSIQLLAEECDKSKDESREVTSVAADRDRIEGIQEKIVVCSLATLLRRSGARKDGIEKAQNIF